MAQDPAFTDELAEELFEFDAGSRPTAAITFAITRVIAHWAQRHGWAVRTEAHVEPGEPYESARQLGFVDVLIRRGAELPDVAIEIDSADKPWSVVKLQHAAAAGMHAIWVRWGDDAWAGVYDRIDVIQLRTMRRTGHRARSDQLTVW